MKRNFLFPLLLITLISGCTTQKNDSLVRRTIPETTDLHPEKYTFRLVQASGDGEAFDPLEQSKKWFSIDAISRIELSNPIYKELANVKVELGEKFSSENGLITGIVWDEVDFSGAKQNRKFLASFEYSYRGTPIKHTEREISSEKWVCDGFGGSNRVEYILFKLYEPQK
jgi:hypothetical protein